MSPQHIDIAHWAGLGGVRYIPSEYVDPDTATCKDLTQLEQKLVNQRNMELVRINTSDKEYVGHFYLSLFLMQVATLRSTDSAFSLGEGPDHSMCVRFGI